MSDKPTLARETNGVVSVGVNASLMFSRGLPRKVATKRCRNFPSQRSKTLSQSSSRCLLSREHQDEMGWEASATGRRNTKWGKLRVGNCSVPVLGPAAGATSRRQGQHSGPHSPHETPLCWPNGGVEQTSALAKPTAEPRQRCRTIPTDRLRSTTLCGRRMRHHSSPSCLGQQAL